jgi:hypothetical protein
METPHPGRRAVARGMIGGALAAALGGVARPLQAARAVPEAATLLVPGAETGEVARFATQTAAALARGLVQAAALRVVPVGGADGITAANRFAAATPADGRAMLLLLPGAAAQAHLVGDTRARFEPRNWPAICGSVQPALLAGRGQLNDTAPLRLALPGPGAPETAALMVLELLGRRVQPVFTAQPEAALAQGAADALVLCGPMAHRATALGVSPWFAFDGPEAARDPALPQLPGLGELLADHGRHEGVVAARAAGAALRTRALLVLPPLTAADSVALWRGAGQRWAEGEPDALDGGARRIGGAGAAALLATLCPAPEVALTYREWLARRLSWRAG